MANTSAYVSAGKPMAGGAVYVAPAGTALPTTANAELNEAFKSLGYISEDGVTNSNERTSENIKAWGGDIVLSPQTEKTDTFSMTFIESLNENVLKAVYGDENVSGTLATGLTVKSNAGELDSACWVIDMIMTGGYKRRFVIPNGKVTAVGEVSYTDNAAIGYETTITGFPDSNGDTHIEYTAARS